jgi:hypothetical protein
MKARMTHAARVELANANRSRYGAASGNAKRRILDEFIAASGCHEKSAIRVLNEVPADKERQTRNRPSLCDEATRATLIVLWEASDRVCGKRLLPDQTALELLVEFQVRYPGRCSHKQLHTLQKRVRVWRQQAVQRLINEVSRAPCPHSIEA